MAVRNPTYLYIAVVLFGICCASQMFGGELGQLMGLLPPSVQGPTRTVVNVTSGLACLSGVLIFILAFLSRPGGGGM